MASSAAGGFSLALLYGLFQRPVKSINRYVRLFYCLCVCVFEILTLETFNSADLALGMDK